MVYLEEIMLGMVFNQVQEFKENFRDFQSLGGKQIQNWGWLPLNVMKVIYLMVKELFLKNRTVCIFLL